MNTADPLAQLRDIHLPEPVSAWPPAPGWWVLTAIILLAVFYISKALIKRHQRMAFQQQAITELKQLGEQYQQQPGEYLQALNRLLKRTALICHPSQQVASLAGKEWLAFLDQSGSTQQFSQGAGQYLMDGPYAAPSENTLTQDQLNMLAELAQHWLKRQRRL